MNHLGDTNKMVSDTPKTDDRVVFIDGDPYVNASFARWFERELNAANDHIKRLEEAGDRMRLYCADPDDCFAWDKAKETKP